VFVKKIRQTCVVFLTAREEEELKKKKKKKMQKSLLSFLFHSVSSSLLQQTYQPRATIFITLVTIT